jgi:hypothetical protein
MEPEQTSAKLLPAKPEPRAGSHGWRRPGYASRRCIDPPLMMPQNKRKSSPVPVDVDGPSKRSRREKPDGEFRSIKASIVLAVPPVFAKRLRDGVEEMLDTMIMR